MLALVLIGFKLWAREAAAAAQRLATGDAPVVPAVVNAPAATATVAPAPLPLETDEEADTVGEVTDEPIGHIARPSLLQRMAENQRLRWPYMRRVCAIVAAQLLLTAPAVALFISYEAIIIKHWDSPFGILIVFLILCHVLLVDLSVQFRRTRTINLLVLALYTLCVIPFVAMSAVLINGKVVLFSGILSPVVVAVLTACRLWVYMPQRSVCNYPQLQKLWPLLLWMFGFYLLVQMIILPCSSKLLATVDAVVATLTFTGLLTIDMGNLATGHMQDDYVLVAINIYLDVVNLFVSVFGFGGFVAGCQWPGPLSKLGHH